MKRILCIVGSMNAGGAETFMMKIFRSLDREKYSIDFAVAVNEPGIYDKEISKLGGNIYHIVPKTRSIKEFVNSIYHIVKTNDYRSVLRISQNSTSVIELLIAKMAGAKKVALRSSNSDVCGGNVEKLCHMIFKPFAMSIPDVKIAPSYVAATFMFGRKSVQNGNVCILKNGLELEEYSFNEDNREEYRHILGVDDNSRILCHIGRFNYQKNHKFLIDFFEKYKNIDQSAKLVLIGTGELEENIRGYVRQKKVKDVIFMGPRNDVPDLLSAMDLFILPSLFEGMPNTVIEAQANGLPCLVSDTITDQVNITNNVFFLPLSDINCWVNRAIAAKRISSKEAKEHLIDSGYDIKCVAKQFVSLMY